MNQNAQTERYKLLVSHLNSYQRNDCYYSSACFLLSTDSRLTELSLPHISHDGIDFLAIKRKMRGGDDMRKNVIDIAYSLFKKEKCVCLSINITSKFPCSKNIFPPYTH